MAIKVIRAVAVECDDCGFNFDEIEKIYIALWRVL